MNGLRTDVIDMYPYEWADLFEFADEVGHVYTTKCLAFRSILLGLFDLGYIEDLKCWGINPQNLEISRPLIITCRVHGIYELAVNFPDGDDNGTILVNVTRKGLKKIHPKTHFALLRYLSEYNGYMHTGFSIREHELIHGLKLFYDRDDFVLASSYFCLCAQAIIDSFEDIQPVVKPLMKGILPSPSEELIWGFVYPDLVNSDSNASEHLASNKRIIQ